MVDTAYLSVQIPREKKVTLEEIANRKGISIQSLMNSLVDNLIQTETRQLPTLDRVLAILRTQEDVLRNKGIEQLYVFGSVARGETGPESDIDIMADFDPSSKISIVTLGSITAYLEEILGYKVDFADRESFRPEVLKKIEREAIRVFA